MIYTIKLLHGFLYLQIKYDLTEGAQRCLHTELRPCRLSQSSRSPHPRQSSRGQLDCLGFLEDVSLLIQEASNWRSTIWFPLSKLEEQMTAPANQSASLLATRWNPSKPVFQVVWINHKKLRVWMIWSNSSLRFEVKFGLISVPHFIYFYVCLRMLINNIILYCVIR